MLRNLAGLPKDLVLYLARHECGTKICREKGIEYARLEARGWRHVEWHPT